MRSICDVAGSHEDEITSSTLTYTVTLGSNASKFVAESNDEIIAQTDYVSEHVPIRSRVQKTPVDEIIYQLTESGSYPTAAESGSLEEFREKCTSEASALKSKSEYLQEKISSLCRQLAQIHRARMDRLLDIQECESFLAPIRRVPREILEDIFVYCLPEEIKPDPTAPPLLLCQINSFWRQIALQHSRLWSSLCVYCPVSNPRDYKEYDSANALCYAMELWFLRSRNSPFSLTLIAQMVVGIVSERIVDVILRKAHRIHTLTVHSSGIESLSKLWKASPGRFTALQNLKLCLADQTAEWSMPITAFTSSPILRTIAFHAFPPNLFRIHLPFDQITNFNMVDFYHVMTIPIWRRLLESFRNLREASFIIKHADDPIRTISMNQLESLSVEFRGKGDASFLQKIGCPMLEKLEIFGTWPYFTWNTTSWVLSIHNLKHLALYYVKVESSVLIQLLSYTSQMEQLKLTLRYDDEDISIFLAGITLWKSETEDHVILPRLEKLLMRLDHLNRSISEKFCDLILSRYKRKLALASPILSTLYVSLLVTNPSDDIQAISLLLNASDTPTASETVSVKISHPGIKL
ncbi:hypothetical protein BDQ12DRAFT_738394 [Crucibulum laeve]|uniref:F-box domain-containing protein n=1 Tax=Crucibulum laeve TaxID=68775 RepID=A0A5C3LP90_9AGAR|nr:hypothetical protein BDQ12DRAFT_738394 [Crucibulum laeve]